jgi:hypothetical protein
MRRIIKITLPRLVLGLITLTAYEDLAPHDMLSLLDPSLQRS